MGWEYGFLSCIYLMRQCPGRIQFTAEDGQSNYRKNIACYVSACATSIISSKSFLSPSSLPVSSNEFVIAALPFSTLVITYEQPNQCASARSVGDQRAGWSGCEW